MEPSGDSAALLYSREKAKGVTDPKSGEIRDPEPLLELGFTDFVVSVQGPDWDLAPLSQALAWRDSLG